MTHEDMILLGDIGGTHIRLALFKGGQEVAATDLGWPAPPDLPALMSQFLDTHQARPLRAALSIAAPVEDNGFELVNVLHQGQPYHVNADRLKEALGLNELHLLNDAAAIALTLPHLDSRQCLAIGGGTSVTGAPLGLVAPGTGLGVASLIFAHGQAIAIPAQGGHVTMAAATAREAAVLEAMRPRHPHISAERVCSGVGLPSLYKGVAAVQGVAWDELSAAEIASRAAAGTDPVATETMSMFFEMLGTVAGNLALTLGTLGGIYLGGGILPKLLPQFMASNFRARFESKGRYTDYMKKIPTYLVTAPHPAYTGLLTILNRSIP